MSQQFLFGRQQGEVLGEFLGGKILAHRSLSIDSGVGHKRGVVAHRTSVG
jgi:hypothetical protein